MAINWKIRFLNPSWWTSFVPALVICMQAIASCFDLKLDLGDKTDTILAAVNSVFIVLTLLGVTSDFTTAGYGDSDRALQYDKPYERDVNHDGLVNEADIDELFRRLDALDVKVPKV